MLQADTAVVLLGQLVVSLQRASPLPCTYSAPLAAQPGPMSAASWLAGLTALHNTAPCVVTPMAAQIAALTAGADLSVQSTGSCSSSVSLPQREAKRSRLCRTLSSLRALYPSHPGQALPPAQPTLPPLPASWLLPGSTHVSVIPLVPSHPPAGAAPAAATFQPLPAGAWWQSAAQGSSSAGSVAIPRPTMVPSALGGDLNVCGSGRGGCGQLGAGAWGQEGGREEQQSMSGWLAGLASDLRWRCAWAAAPPAAAVQAW